MIDRFNNDDSADEPNADRDPDPNLRGTAPSAPASGRLNPSAAAAEPPPSTVPAWFLEGLDAAALYVDQCGRVRSANSAFFQLLRLPGEPGDLIGRRLGEVAELLGECFDEPEEWAVSIFSRDPLESLLVADLKLKEGPQVRVSARTVASGRDRRGWVWTFRAREGEQPGADAVVTLDAHGRITSWDERAAAIFGLTAEQVVGTQAEVDVPTLTGREGGNGAPAANRVRVPEAAPDPLDGLHRHLLELGDDNEANIRSIAACAGRLVGASHTLYERMENRVLSPLVDPGETGAGCYCPGVSGPGTISYDLTYRWGSKAGVHLIRNLLETDYASGDPRVVAWNPDGYAGLPVRSGETCTGVLSFFFDGAPALADEALETVRRAAAAIASEERRLDAARRLREDERRYRQAFERGADATVLHFLDGSIVEANTSACELLGYPRQQLLALNVLQLHPPSALEDYRREFARVWKSGRLEAEFQFRRADGSCFPAAVSARLSEVDSRPVIQCTFRDITAQEAAQSHLQAEHGRLAQAFAALPDALVTLDPNLVVTGCNPAAEALLGLASGDAVGRGLDDVVSFGGAPPGASPLRPDAVRQRADVGGFSKVEMLTRSGARRRAQAAIAPLHDGASDEITGFVLTLRAVDGG